MKIILGGGLGSEKAIQRIVELSKKNRDLMSQLEAEKNNTRKLSTKLNNVNNQACTCSFNGTFCCDSLNIQSFIISMHRISVF